MVGKNLNKGKFVKDLMQKVLFPDDKILYFYSLWYFANHFWNLKATFLQSFINNLFVKLILFYTP